MRNPCRRRTLLLRIRDRLVTPVAEILKQREVPFAVASAYDKPEQFGGEVLAGVPNVGKPTTEHRLLAALGDLTGG